MSAPVPILIQTPLAPASGTIAPPLIDPIIQNFNNFKLNYVSPKNHAHLKKSSDFIKSAEAIENMVLDIETRMHNSVLHRTAHGIPLVTQPKKVVSRPGTAIHVLFLMLGIPMMRLQETNHGIKFTGLNITTEFKSSNPIAFEPTTLYSEEGGPSYQAIANACYDEGVDLRNQVYHFTSFEHHPADIYMVVEIRDHITWKTRVTGLTSSWIGIDSDTLINSTAIDPHYHQLATYNVGSLHFVDGYNGLLTVSKYRVMDMTAVGFLHTPTFKKGVVHFKSGAFVYYNQADQFETVTKSTYTCRTHGLLHTVKVGQNICEKEHDD